MNQIGASSSILIISDDRELVDTLIHSTKTEQEFIARDSVQFLLEDPSLLDSNGIIIFDISSGDKDVETAVDQVLTLKQQDPTQVLILVGEPEQLGNVLKSGIQSVIYRAFTKPVSANQVTLSFSSAKALHLDLVEKRAAGIDITGVGPSENRSNVASIREDRKTNPLVFAVIALLALVVAGWLIFSADDQDSTNEVAESEVIKDSEATLSEEPELVVSASVQRINELNQMAADAMLEDRIIAPKGNNALEYYDQVLAIDAYDSTAYKGKKAIADRLRESYNVLVANAEFDRALKVINVLQRIEPLNLDNDSLRGGLEKAIDVHVKRVKESGSSEEIASTAAVLKKIESQFEGSKSASDALQKEQKLIVRIDSALEENILIPPQKNNAYGLVSDALKTNSVSNANLTPRVKALSSKLMRAAQADTESGNVENASKLAALIKRLNVDRKGHSSLSKAIEDKKAELAKAAAESGEVAKAAQEDQAEPEPPKIIPAKIISRAPPRYPARAQNKGLEGWVEVKFKIDRRGVPTSIQVVSAEPANTFESAALRAVEKWRFSPARNEETGLAVESPNVSTKLQFKLD